MDIELDLVGAIRPGLDILANEIVIALKKRSRFLQNPEIYQPGLVIGRPSLSLLEHELAKVEAAHAELGRYTYANQESFTDVAGIPLVINRAGPESPVRSYPCEKGNETIRFYRMLIEADCEPGTDSDTFGETVTTDVAALQGIFERITLGKYVAQYKYQQNSQGFIDWGGDTDAMRRLFVTIGNGKRRS